jgi:hypothetical protein
MVVARVAMVAAAAVLLALFAGVEGSTNGQALAITEGAVPGDGFLVGEEYDSDDCSGDARFSYGFRFSDIPQFGTASCIDTGMGQKMTFFTDDNNCAAQMYSLFDDDCSGAVSGTVSILELMGECELNEEEGGSRQIVGCSSVRPGPPADELHECISEEVYAAIVMDQWPDCVANCGALPSDCIAAHVAAATGGCASSCIGDDAVTVRAMLIISGVMDCFCLAFVADGAALPPADHDHDHEEEDDSHAHSTSAPSPADSTAAIEIGAELSAQGDADNTTEDNSRNTTSASSAQKMFFSGALASLLFTNL